MNANEQIEEQESIACQNGHYKVISQSENTILSISTVTLLKSNN